MDNFSPKHFVFLMLAATIVGLKTYPTVYMNDSGRDSWIAVIVSSALIAVFFVFATKTMNKADNPSLLKVYQTACGKWLGGFLLILYTVTALLVLVESACVEADSMHQNMLVETPIWYFMLFFILPAIYVVRKNLVAVVVISIIGISLIMLAGIHLGILTTQQKDLSNLLPIMEYGVTKGFWLSVVKSLGLYGSISLTLPYVEFIQYKRKSMTKYVLVGLFIIIQMIIVSVTGVIMTFNLPTAESYYYPKLIQTHLVSYYEMLEFGELYVMLQILGGWLLKYLVAFHAVLIILRSFGLKERAIHVLILVFSGLVFIGSYLAAYTSIRLFALLEYVPWIFLVNFVLIPAVILVLFRIRQKQTAKDF